MTQIGHYHCLQVETQDINGYLNLMLSESISLNSLNHGET